ncbi:hypothetical protein glysoja_038415 [Glycine soja]|uniref:Uncharacterized protein n=1 Tax=Glycine soja TaxID=3848 RepID=A0A0B2S4M1_GLYSO|nr:hypothetical protein glysoja_038415 [Glycine soja]
MLKNYYQSCGSVSHARSSSLQCRTNHAAARSRGKTGAPCTPFLLDLPFASAHNSLYILAVLSRVSD